MSYKIVTDSSSDLVFPEDLGIDGADPGFASVPLTIVAGERQFVDDANIDVEEMVEFLSTYRGRSSTACPSMGEWLAAFGDADYVVGTSITGKLSASHDAAMMAKEAYEAAHPGRRVFILDSLSTGPEMRLIAEKARDLIRRGTSFDDIVSEITAYHERTHIAFALQSLTNLANNGRVNPAVAKVAGLLGVRAVGRASAEGELDVFAKCRGEKKTLATIADEMERCGFSDGRAHIAYVVDAEPAVALKALLEKRFPAARIDMHPTRALCSFYGERGGLIVGYEGA